MDSNSREAVEELHEAPKTPVEAENQDAPMDAENRSIPVDSGEGETPAGMEIGDNEAGRTGEDALYEKKQELEEKELMLQAWEQNLQEQERNLQKKEQDMRDARKQLMAGQRELDDLTGNLNVRETDLNDWKNRLEERSKKLDEREMSVGQRERSVWEREQSAAQEAEEALRTARERAAEENGKSRQETASTLERMRSEAEEAVNQLYLEADRVRQKKQEDQEKELAKKREAQEEELAKMRKAQEEDLKEKREAQEREFAEKEKKLRQREDSYEKAREELDLREQRIVRREDSLNRREDELDSRSQDLDEEIEDKCQDFRRSMEEQLRAKDEELERLRSELVQKDQALDSIKKFQAQYGNLNAVLKEMAKLRVDNEKLSQDLAERPVKAVEKEREQLKMRVTELEGENETLSRQVTNLMGSQRETNRLEAENLLQKDKLNDTENRLKNMDAQCKYYQDEIARLRTDQSRLAERDERLKAIRAGLLSPLEGFDIPGGSDECQWLDNIYSQCDAYGLHFPRRLLYAFHTALKISDWSMLTVLSGVSGTGKSELPKLYAAFGGMNFINVPVQPSWDSQESMLGFFNSIDNRFEPEPLLRFLVQCTEDPAYEKYMSIVLLDEMNLAHVEHYFADFLSKLETRRNTGRNAVPTVEVKLGAGVDPYQLKLNRSILWTGTMNQDETTKSLSDKVLDRGLVLYFPRPEHFKDRSEMKSLDSAVKNANRPLMTKEAWGGWICRSLRMGDEIQKRMDRCRGIVEDINRELEGVGRALGHRVWQSIAYYIANYPTVRRAVRENGDLTPDLEKAMDTAFEDQLVQKVMPKLRGIETRGVGERHLRTIQGILENEGFGRLKGDFDLAMNLGYGQFIWSSAKYLQEEDEASDAAGVRDDGESG